MCKFRMPKDSWFKKKKVKTCSFIWGILFIVGVAWVLPEYKEEMLKFRDMHQDDLMYSIRKIDSIDFLSGSVKDKHLELSTLMPMYCKDDVLFGFQFSKQNRTIRDHLFMLCESKQIFANAEIIYSKPNYVLSNEQYADITLKKKRSSSVIVKAIDIKTWDVIEYESTSTKEACIMQHAIDVLNSKWV